MVVFAYDFFSIKRNLQLSHWILLLLTTYLLTPHAFRMLFYLIFHYGSSQLTFMGIQFWVCKIRKIICQRNDDGTRLPWRLWYNPLYGIFMICLMKLMICSQGIIRMKLFGNYFAYMNVRWCPNQPARDTCIIIVCSRTCIPINIIHPAKSRIQSDPKPRWPSQNPSESDFQSELLFDPGGSTIIKYEIVYPAISDRVHDHEIHLKHTCMHS